ncbi:SDR family oxidoreductase [Uliginosibacterium sp. TH139]|uniref:SDR family oxidoreductase n=1 Tax=Uliginosibacterium sp. TH139 TaxID=2067453 RepID=UPI00130401B7|nr:SDR family oxidoreductase [Uliginosibacterium sp. TH139]
MSVIDANLKAAHPERCSSVLVTGAASRIGRSIAIGMHADGANVAVHYNKSDAEARDLVLDMNRRRAGSAVSIQADLRGGECERIIDQVVDFFGGLDVLVNNASVFLKDGESFSDSLSEENYRVNFLAPYFLSKSAVSSLVLSSGCIVNIADINGDYPLEGYSLYSASKAALLNLTRSMAAEFSPFVRVNAVSPGAICWPVNSSALSEVQRKNIIGHSLLKREGSPWDVYKAVRYLAFDAPYVTGSVINVDGGRMARM